MSIKSFTALSAAAILVVKSCTSGWDPSDNDSDSDWTDKASATGSGKTEIVIPDIALSDSYTDGSESIPEDDDDFVENSSFSKSVVISYDGTSATVSGLVDGVTATVNGADVIINSTIKAVEYTLSGTTTNGSFKIYSSNKFKLTLNGTNITSTTGAAINIQSTKRVFIVIADGTTNSLTDASSYTATVTGEDMKACLFSEAQIAFSGSGKLSVKGNYKHAICCDDYIRMRKNTNITVTGAASDGIHVNDYFIQEGGTLKITSSGDGIDVENEKIDINGGQLYITTSGAAKKGMKCGANININGGTLIINTSGSGEYDSDEKDISSCACIKCDSNFVFKNATAAITSTGAAGKGISVDGTATFESGTLIVKTTGKQYIYQNLDSSPKGIKAEGDLTINGGEIKVVCSGGEGSEGIESKSNLTINDGTIEAECYDDCINAASSISVNGGKIYCYSSNNDAMDSNGTLSFTGGLTICSGTTTPEEGIDCDQNNFSIKGGIVIGVGGASSTPTANSCTQRSVLYGTSASEKALISIVNSSSKALMTYDIPRNYSQQMTMLYSSPDLAANQSYTFCAGGVISGGTTFHGFTYGHTLTNFTEGTTFTSGSVVTTINTTTGGGGGQPGGRM